MGTVPSPSRTAQATDTVFVTVSRMVLGLSTSGRVALGVSLIACAFDLRTRKIPNALTFGAAIAALFYAYATHGVAGLATSAGAWLTACAIFFPFFALRGLGAGDVKLAACIGAWLTPSDALRMSLYAMVAGGVMAVVVAFAAGYARTAFANLSLLLTHWRVVGVTPMPDLTLAGSRGPRLPYALPVAVGTAIDLFWR